MLGYQINPEDVKLIERVNFIKTEFTDSVCNIYIKATMTYGVEEYFLVGRIFKDWKHQGNYTYINGVEKEYKCVKPVLNAIMKQDWFGLEYDKILIFAGLKKDITETRIYKKLMKEQATQQTENIETTETKTSLNSDSIEVVTNSENTNVSDKNLKYVLNFYENNMLIYEFNTLGVPNTEEEAILWMENFQKLRNKLVENNQVIFESQIEAKMALQTAENIIKERNIKTDVNSEIVTTPVNENLEQASETLETENQDPSITDATITSQQPVRNKIIEMIEDENLKIELYQALNNGFKIGYTSNQRGIPQATYENYDKGLFIIINPSRLQADYVSKYLYTIEDKIKEVYCIEDMELIKDLYHNNHDEFIQVIKEDSENQINQYSYEDIKIYFENLFQLESIIPAITEQQQELKRIALSVLNRGYSIELKEDTFSYLIYLQQNKNIEGYLWINKNQWIQDKKLKLINESLKPLLTKYNDLSVCIYGVTDSINGIIPINTMDSAITVQSMDSKIPENKISKASITEVTTEPTQTIKTDHNKPTITQGFTTLKQAEGVQIIGKIESHTSYISNETYNMVTDIKIYKDNNLLYEAYRVDFPINIANKDMIDINNYLDDIILYINSTTIEPYWLTMQLDKLLKDKNTMNFQVQVKHLKNKIVEKKRIRESQQREKELQELKTNIIELANNKNMLVAIGSENIRLLKGLQQRQESKDFIKMILDMDINDKMIKPYLIKSFEAGNIVGLTYSEINKRLLLETREYLEAM